MKSPGRILVLVLVTLTALASAAFAIRPSGPGINTKANSLSVALATDQPSVPVHPGATLITAMTASTADVTASCKDGLLVADPDAGTATIVASGTDASTALTNLTASERIPVGVAKITAATAKLYCLSH